MKFLKAANIVQIRGFSCKKYSKYTFVFFFSECLKFFFPVWRVGVSIFLPVVKSFSQCLPGAVRSYRYILDIMYIDCISIYVYSLYSEHIDSLLHSWGAKELPAKFHNHMKVGSNTTWLAMIDHNLPLLTNGKHY